LAQAAPNKQTLFSIFGNVIAVGLQNKPWSKRFNFFFSVNFRILNKIWLKATKPARTFKKTEKII
jgi:hypothetical protein